MWTFANRAALVLVVSFASSAALAQTPAPPPSTPVNPAAQMSPLEYGAIISNANAKKVAGAALDEALRASLEREALEELAGFRSGMTAEAFARARGAVVDRLVRTHFGLPTISLR